MDEESSDEITEWDKAQELEKEWWDGYIKEYTTFESWKDKALQTLKRITEVFQITKEELGTVLEIGCGGLPLIANLDGKEHIGIEPLADKYSSYKFIKELNIIAQPVEEVVLNITFDSIVCDNVIDHCYNPVKVLENIAKWSHKDTNIYFGVYVRLLPFRPDMHPNSYKDERVLFNQFRDAKLIVKKRVVHSNNNHYYLLKKED